MNILLVSQCQKNALTETRRILDQFAERCGDRVWQTAITQAGLETLYKMLRQTARKNTAVACYWTHRKNSAELLWIVGDRRQFNDQGRVPTNRTQRNILRAEEEMDWQDAYSLQILTALSALLHDVGKSSVGFQAKLDKTKNAPRVADSYRHEWISARLFEAMIEGCQTDQAWLERLANWQVFEETNPTWFSKIIQDRPNENHFSDFAYLPPLARRVIWLITSHHRLPFTHDISRSQDCIKNLRKYAKLTFESLFKAYKPAVGWVSNGAEHPTPQAFWQFQRVATQSQAWQKHMARWAKKALNHPALFSVSENADPFLLLLARLCLMTGDHYYSAQDQNEKLGELNFPLLANTYRENHQPKQRLDEHLIGVCQTAVRFARLLPKFPRELPRIKQHKPFVQLAKDRFAWQNKAVNVARLLQQTSESQGFFGVNMASTGCGKTLANAKMMYALNDSKQGARFTIALGLRVLTLQTGSALKKRLHLSDQDLAVLVGGSAVKKLYALQQEKQNQLAQQGSESAEDWLENIQVEGATYIESAVENEAILSFLSKDDKTKKLLYAPIVSCTLDHLISASESVRGGHHIVPILRLLTSDLILDEPDDFAQEDLPALSRLVYLAGLFGSRVLLSSATLTPDFITGLFKAYQAGRKIYNQQKGIVASLPICCAWVDEFQQVQANCGQDEQFIQQHDEFVRKRAENLAKSPVRRQAEILSLPSLKPREGEELHYGLLADTLLQKAIALHDLHGQTDPHSQKKVSVGLIRFSNIEPMIPLAKALFALQASEKFADYQVHLCCYHSRQLLLLRSYLEEKLDKILDRHTPEQLFEHEEIALPMSQYKAKNHLFIVLGSPVTEVGRDHDYDWAIVDPSSMRSIIQLAGRVWRHRAEKVTEQPNIALLPINWRGLKVRYQQKDVIYHRPGFESHQHKLATHKLEQLISQRDLAHIQATPRIVKPEVLQASTQLADLEHHAIASLLNHPSENLVNLYWDPHYCNYLLANLPLMSEFRKSMAELEVVCVPDEDSHWGFGFYRAQKRDEETLSALPEIQYEPIQQDKHAVVQPWLAAALDTVLSDLAEQLNVVSPEWIAPTYLCASLPQYDGKLDWHYNEVYGFW
ncbi:type I-F CRISPR-associated helicase Cas3f [Pasteurella multocida]|uniref:type I-F CRISPR-associated helicase Cas3f n=1 Tax=Pasteurella multocida TaxID=747 RepID=UPI002301139B|nr:type I-F CRISPR-associated helicase Cas3f [Pasteurella multocida]MDA5607167.1 type I-F CRISPR-associated helicase Cas3f [Pasteurella multocida subsp. multocida]MDA5614919.1 type I-F CRISPR-associated helicase Cas3f [Pasteurella multocida]MDA5624838.1 type I-F CRISPR-associated helicase Cas3f [Pasteurella multocida]